MTLSTLILAAAESPSIIDTFGITAPQLISQIVLFLIVYFVLQKFAFGPLLTVLEQRKTKIAESLDNADRIKKELADAEVSRKEILRKANEQATALITDAQKAAGAQGEKKLQEAVAQAEALIRKAQEQTELDRQKMMLVLKGELANLVIDTTSKVTGKILTAEDQKRLGDETALQLRS
jgi:F-type H+-transporting ATPase subunit b